jgi:hypothetical protein
MKRIKLVSMASAYMQYVMYVCMYEWMDVILTFEGVLFVFGVEEYIRHRPVLGESKHFSSKNGPLSGEPKHKTFLTILIKFQ